VVGVAEHFHVVFSLLPLLDVEVASKPGPPATLAAQLRVARRKSRRPRVACSRPNVVSVVRSSRLGCLTRAKASEGP